MTINEVLHNEELSKYIHFYSQKIFNRSSLQTLMEHDDIKQLIFIELMKNLHKFNPDKCNIRQFITREIKTVIFKQIRSFNGAKKDYVNINKLLSMDYKVDGEFDFAEMIADDFDLEKALVVEKLDINKYLSYCDNEKDRQIVVLLAKGYTPVEIYKSGLMSQPTLWRRLNKLKDKIQKGNL